MLYVLNLFGQFVAYEQNDTLFKVLDRPEFAIRVWDCREMVVRGLTLILEGLSKERGE
jgi:hypothetical protein